VKKDFMGFGKPKKKPRRQLSGAAKMRQSGKHPILLGVTPEDLELLRQAAALERRPVAQFVVFHSLAAAAVLLSKNLNP
jgi:uncharacterized protein (DUF1778 family)